LRRDFTIEDEPDYVNLIISTYYTEIKAESKPKKILMYLFDEVSGWSNPYEKTI
jgi:hypothetical protein